MADDDRLSTSQESDDESSPISVPSHDPLPLPPEVHYTRPVPGLKSGQATGQSSRTEYSHQTHDAPAPVKYANGLAGGVTLMSSILAGYWLGDQIDTRWLHAGTPWATIVMVLAGTFAGFYNMFRLLNRADGRKR